MKNGLSTTKPKEEKVVTVMTTVPDELNCCALELHFSE